MGLTELFEIGMSDRPVGASLINLPYLFALQVEGIGIVGIEMGIESLALPLGAIDIRLCLGAQCAFHRLGNGS